MCVYNIQLYMQTCQTSYWFLGEKGGGDVGDMAQILWNLPKRYDVQNYAHIQVG